MRRNKAEVDKYISSVESSSPSLKEKPIKGFLFAKLYFEAKEYELAKRHVSEYLKVVERDPKAHKFLGQLYEREGDINKAVGCYKRSVDLNPAQRDLVLKVAELLVSKTERDSRAEFWVEKAAKLLPGHPAVFNLKEHLLNQQGQQGWNQLFDLLQKELAVRPGDAHINIKLVQLFSSDGRLEEAVKHCLATEKRGLLRSSLDWYSTVVHTLQEFLAQPSVSSNEKMSQHQQRELLLAHCSLLRLTLPGKGLQPSIQALRSFDSAMHGLKKAEGSVTDDLSEVYVEMRGHLYLHAGTLLLKMAQEREQQWRAVIDLAALCYLLAYQVPRPKSKVSKGDQSPPQPLELLASDRKSQAGHMLLNLKPKTHTFVREVVEAFGNRSGQGALFELLFGPLAPAGTSFIGNDDICSINTQAPEISDLTKWDNGSIQLHGGDLQQLCWLGLQWSLLAQRPALRDWLKQLFPRLNLETSKLDTNTPESICLLDLEVFLCGVVWCSHNQLQERARISSTGQQPRCLPLPLLHHLFTDRQRDWWDAVYRLIHKRAAPGMSAKLRMTVQHGLSTLRAGEKHGLQPALPIHWAQHLSSAGFGVNSYEYIRRSVHYWKVVLPLLDKIKRRRGIPGPLDPLFIHFPSRDIEIPSVKGFEEEAKIAFATLLDIEGKTEEAIATLETINNISSNWQLARVCSEGFTALPWSWSLSSITPKTPPHWAEDQKSLLQMLCQQVESLKNEVHDLRHHSSDSMASPHQRMYGDGYGSESRQEGYPPAQTFHGAPLTVATTQAPSMYYNQSPAYNAGQYLLRTAANVTPTKAESSTPSAAGFSFTMPITAGGFKFGTQDTAKETLPTGQDENPLFTGKPNDFSFADLAKNSQGDFQFGETDSNFKGFTRAGEQLFTSLQSNQRADTSADQDEEDIYKTEENDDIQFEPVVQMPEKVDLVTGEEDEQAFYSQRVKLFRFDGDISQWKERGVGVLKFLKNATNGRLRVLMRREQVLKVCANHWITTTMNLKPLAGSDKAWMWLANDFSDGDARLEQLAAKFKTPELAEEFKLKFEECQRLLLDIPLQTPHKLVDMKAEERKSGLKSFLTDDKTKIKEDNSQANITTASNTSDLIIKPHVESTVPTLEWDNYDLREEALDDSADTSVYASPLASSPIRKNLFCFGESTAGFNFSFQPVVSPTKSPAKMNQSGVSVDEEQDISQEEERDGLYFEPVVPLPDLVEISTGEENENVCFSHRAKLYRYDKDLNQWKERGIGDLKILQNYDTKRVRLIMRRDQVLKICANHWVTSSMKLEPMKGAEKAWVWSAIDFAEVAKGNVEQLAVRFKLKDVANSFRDIFDQAKTAQENEILVTPIASSETLPQEEAIATGSTVCGQDAVAILEETTTERTELNHETLHTPDCKSSTGIPHSPLNPSRMVMSPPKFLFGTDSLQKFFGSSPLSSKEDGSSEVKDSGWTSQTNLLHLLNAMMFSNLKLTKDALTYFNFLIQPPPIPVCLTCQPLFCRIGF
uniref:RAN binding protein 2 n=1 Tax=Hucho hucho TaxID=62062 RepID=A0A4W5RYE5_9TELE